MSIVTIDTNILIKAFEDREPIHNLIVNKSVLQDGPKIGVDFDDVVLGEYRKNLKSNLGFNKWYKKVSQRGGFSFVNGRLPEKHKKNLRPLGCHEPTDHQFLGVALRTDRIFISEDSDVGKGPNGCVEPHISALKYITDDMKVNVYDADEACSLFY